MKRASLKMIGALAALVATAAGCAEQKNTPLEPAAVPQQSAYTMLSAPKKMEVLQRSPGLAGNLTARATIGSAGGEIRIPDAGLTLKFAPGALSKNTTITATAVAGRLVAYEFQPHGLKFNAPVWVIQEVTRTGFAGNPSQIFNAQGGYAPNLGTLNQSTGLVDVTEVMGVGQWGTGSAVFEIRHFSGYVLSTGRTQLR